MIMNNNVRKTIGFTLTLVVGFIAGWVFAWNQTSIEEFISSIGGVGNLLVALIGLAALVLAIFWPKKWSAGLHRVLIAVVILGLIFGAASVFGDAFQHAPWLTILILIVAIVVILVLHGITVLDHPVKAWKTRIRKKKP